MEMLRTFALLAALVAFAPAVVAGDDKPAAKKPAAKGKIDRTKLFGTMDADGDGKVTKDEYKKGMEGVAEKLKERAADKGKGGAALEKLGGQLADRAFDALDADKDGTLTQEEFDKGGFDPAKLKDLREKFGRKKADE
jgi:hypothetical protein